MTKGQGSDEVTFSPHAWGWTGSNDWGRVYDIVFPTRVGVDRLRKEANVEHVAFSPHAWGWTVERRGQRQPVIVFPTRVGVDRTPPTTNITITSFPHTRGGGPQLV